MSAHGETRRRAFEAACTLAAEGQRPTLLSVRERLNGRGGQKAIADGLSDWIDEAATRFAIPGVPEELRAQVVALWDLASRQADGRWARGTRGPGGAPGGQRGGTGGDPGGSGAGNDRASARTWRPSPPSRPNGPG